MTKEISGKIRYIGFIMTCFVVVHHCPELEDIFALNSIDYTIKHCFDVLFNSFASVAMSWFFAITGFLLFVDFSMEKYPTKIKKRISTLFVPYLLWQLIFLILEFVDTQQLISLGELLRRIFLFVRWPVCGPLWYVYTIFLLALLSPPLYYIVRNKKIGWTAILAIIILLRLLGRIDDPTVQKVVNHGYVPNIINLLPAYLAGAFYGFHYKAGKADCLHHLLSGLIIAFVLEGWLTGFFAELCVRFMPIAILYLLPPVNVPERIRNRKFMQVYKLSFLVYALHIRWVAKLHAPVMDIYMRSIGRLTMSTALGTVLMNIIYLSVCIAGAALIHWALSKKAPRLLALLTGGRS